MSCTVSHQALRLRCLLLLNFSLCLGCTASAPLQAAVPALKAPSACPVEVGAFLRARLNGSINIELNWSGEMLSCAGSVRPNAEGIRVRFSSLPREGEPTLVLLFGITGLKEGQSGRALPANLTIMREGKGEFFGTQGDNKCTMDEIRQEPLSGVPLKQRAWRIIARGFCTQPARALNGEGSILVSRFDFTGRAEFYSEDEPSSAITL